MSKSRCREIVEIGDRLFSSRGSLMSLWQDIAENFYPERADFTTTRTLGDDFASYLMTGYPPLQLRELSDQLAAMLRPRSKLWAKLTATNAQIDEDTQARQWLEWASERMRKSMYARRAQFLRSTKVGDRDFCAFGQTAIQISLNPDRDGLLFQTYHLRDVAWCEDRTGTIDAVHRKEKVCARDLVKFFPKTVADVVKNQVVRDEPYKEFEVRHCVIPSEQYDGKGEDGKKINRKRFPFYSFLLDVTNDVILEELPQTRLGYVIPRWNLGAFKQYAVSPAVMLALPDARLMQQMTLSLLEVGEKASNPPMVATLEAVRTDMQLYAGGITWVDREYDERLGDALRPVTQDLRGINHGMAMLEKVQELMKHQFYLNKINLPLPEDGREMTAFETRKRIEEYVRSALPLFEPMEVEYNGEMCNETFALMVENNGFGPPEGMPDILRGADVHFEFESPLQATAERAKAQAFQEAGPIVQAAMQLDPAFVHQLDVAKAGRDALRGVEIPADWLRDPKQVEQMVAAARKVQAQQAQMAQAGQAAEIANKAAPMVSALNR
jgi:hypothetical protein